MHSLNDFKLLIPQHPTNGRGARAAGTTFWGAYNAVNEYLNYFRCKSQNNRMDSLWFGESDRINALALQTALKMAA